MFRTGRVKDAWNRLRVSLEIASETGKLPSAYEAVLEIAWLLAEVGEEKQAADLFAFLADQSAATERIRRLARERLFDLRGNLGE